MSDIEKSGTFTLGDRRVRRLGYGAMQLAGPGVYGSPRDGAEAVAVLREAVASGVDHIDTSDFYGPHITNQLIREALSPYRPGLTIVTKVGAVRDAQANWLPAPEDKFMLMLRFYRPQESLINGSWKIPPVKRTD